MTLPLILDTDIGTDVDDALALALALRHPQIELRAVTTVSGDSRRRAFIAAKLLRAAGRDDIEVAVGLGSETGHPGGMGHEGVGILDDDEEIHVSERHAVELLIDELVTGTGVCASPRLATIGTQSNLAAALTKAPDLVDAIPVLAVMGGVFAPLRLAGEEVPPSADVNLNLDPDASLRALNAGIETLYVPLNVTNGVVIGPRHLERLRRGDDLCRALASLIDVWWPIMRRTTEGRSGEAVAVLHDPLTVACLVDRDLVTSRRVPVTVARHNGVIRTFIDPVKGNEAEVITSVDAAGFAELWLESVLA
jgi:purine nucleosidase